MIVHLEINSLQNKIDALIKLIKVCLIDIICIDETKLGSSFPDTEETEIGIGEGRLFLSRKVLLQIDLMVLR